MGQRTQAGFEFAVGRWYRLRGDITTLATISGHPPADVERRIGFAKGRLSRGYSLFFLIEKMAPDDFIWGDQTCYSGRYQFIRDAGKIEEPDKKSGKTIPPKERVGEYVPRIDVLRGELLAATPDDAAVDAELHQFLRNQQQRINRGVEDKGLGRICRIVPVTGHDPTQFWLHQYPNAPLHGIPQWTIPKGREKKMICVANVLPGAIYG